MKSVGEILESSAEKFGQKPFAFFHNNVLTFRELNNKANQISNWLIHNNFTKGKKALIFMDTSFDWLYVWFGLIKAGIVAIPINTAYKGKLLQYLIKDSDANLMFIDEKYVERIRKIKADIQEIQVVVNSNNRTYQKFGISAQLFSEIFKMPSESPNVVNYYFDTVAMLYTSGTTGPSKGVIQPHGQYVWCGEQVAKQLNLKEDDIFYCWLPLFHIVPVGMIFMSCLQVGSAVALSERFSVSKFWDEVKKYNATITGGFATMIELLYKLPPKKDDAKNPLRQIVVGGIPKKIAEDFEKRFDLILTDDYGMTEVEPISYLTVEDRLKKPGSCGRPVSDIEVKIFDEYDNELKANEIGEIVVRPKKAFIMMKGYYNRPLDTVNSWRNLWFHTGDYGYLDEDGYLYFVDRKKDSIRRRGENISSFELESIINAHPSVLESVAVGVPSKLGEEDVKVIVQLKDGMSLTAEELIEYCESEMAFFMVPRYVEFVQSFPRTETGKILKRELRNINQNTWDREIKDYVN